MRQVIGYSDGLTYETWCPECAEEFYGALGGAVADGDVIPLYDRESEAGANGPATCLACYEEL